MNKNFRAFLTLSFISILATSCGQKLVSSSSSGTSSSSSSSTSTTTSTTGSTSVSGCDGVYRSGASQCYYKNLPEVTLSGPGTYGLTYWSSATDLPTSIPQEQFITDATFSIRMIPSYITDGRSSKSGRKCSTSMGTNFSKMKMKVMIRKSGSSVGVDIAELTATASGGVWSYSNKYPFSVPRGTSSPFILEVVGVQTNHRCMLKSGSTTQTYYGSPLPSCSTTEYADIPVDSGTWTSCVGFKLQMATDETYDLPN